MAAPYELLKVRDEDHWHEIRRTGIGGSDASTVAGLNPYTSPLELWLVKTGAKEPDDLSDVEKVKWGNILEGPVAEEYACRHGAKIRRKKSVLRSKAHPFMLANLDRTVNHPGSDDHPAGLGGLEVKTAGLMMAPYWEEGPPDHYQAQVQHYLGVTGLDWFDVAVLIGGQEYKDFTIYRNQEVIDLLISLESRFWSMVEAGIMPELTGHETEAKALREIYPDAKDEVLDLSTAEAVRWAQQHIEGKALKEQGEAQMDEAAVNLKAMMKESKAAQIGTAKASWPRYEQDSTDLKAMKEAHPAIVAEFTTKKPRDRFTVTPGKD